MCNTIQPYFQDVISLDMYIEREGEKKENKKLMNE